MAHHPMLHSEEGNGKVPVTLKEMVTVGTIAVAILTSYLTLKITVSANSDKLKEVSTEESVLKDTVTAQTTDIALIKEKVNGIGSDVSTLKGDIKTVSVAQTQQTIQTAQMQTQLQNILEALKNLRR